jgi:hypothetical protein
MSSPVCLSRVKYTVMHITEPVVAHDPLNEGSGLNKSRHPHCLYLQKGEFVFLFTCSHFNNLLFVLCSTLLLVTSGLFCAVTF